MSFWSKIILLLICLFVFEIDSKAEDNDFIIEKYQKLFEEKKFEELVALVDEEISDYRNSGDIDYMLSAMIYQAKAYSHQYKFDEAFDLYKTITELAKENDRINVYVNGLSSQISIQMYRGNYTIVKQLSRDMLSAKGVEIESISNAYTFLGSVFNREGNIDSCIFYNEKAVAIDLKTSNNSSLPFSLASLGAGYKMIGDNQKALKTYLEAISFLETGKDDFKMASLNRVIASIFLRLNNYKKAEDYINKSIEIAEQENIILNLSYSKLLLARIYQEYEKIDESKRLFNEALEVFVEKEKNSLAIECYSRLSMIAIDEGDIVMADSLINLANLKRKMISNDVVIYNRVLAEVKINIAKKQYEKAYEVLSILEEGSLLSVNPSLKLRYLESLSLIRQEQGDFEMAINHINEYRDLEANLAQIGQNYLVAEMEAKYNEIENLEKIEQLGQANKINTLLVEKKNLQLYGTLLILILSFLGMFFIYKQNKKIKGMMVEKEVQNAKISHALQEKDVLLKEIHHRVKNNLQIVSSLLNLQSRAVKDDSARNALIESKNRVHSMAMIHQELYQLENLVGINSKNYIEKLTNNLLKSYKVEQVIHFSNTIDEINLDVDTSISLGLIINELITNAIKYAFPGNVEGEIELLLEETAEYLHLQIKDNGIGFDTEIIKKKNSFGLKMVEIFAKKLKAEWLIENNEGTLVSLKIKNYKTV